MIQISEEYEVAGSRLLYTHWLIQIHRGTQSSRKIPDIAVLDGCFQLHTQKIDLNPLQLPSCIKTAKQPHYHTLNQ
jgi:hypothetical protein